jgi:hypothetical protein
MEGLVGPVLVLAVEVLVNPKPVAINLVVTETPAALLSRGNSFFQFLQYPY